MSTHYQVSSWVDRERDRDGKGLPRTAASQKQKEVASTSDAPPVGGGSLLTGLGGSSSQLSQQQQAENLGKAFISSIGSIGTFLGGQSSGGGSSSHAK